VDYKNWGCEFLDTETWQNPSAPLIEAEVFYLPTEAVMSVANANKLASIRFPDREYIQDLAAQISVQGQLKPGVIYTNGKTMELEDGYHRLAAIAEVLHFDKYLVELRDTDAEHPSAASTFIRTILRRGENRGIE